MWEFKVVPQNNFGVAVLCLMVFTSAIWFARKDMMTDDYWFRGFPAAWNLVAPVMFLMNARTTIGAGITIVLSLLALSNVPFPHIARARFMLPYTIVGATVWIGGMVAGTFAYPDHPYYVRIMLYLGSAYFIALAGIRALHDRRSRQTRPA
ncbi:MAG: hypothetical protein ACRDRL_32905, partial [Sciscionella sp.]